jgi:hypothetical protein
MTQFHGTLNSEPLSEKVKEERRRDFAAFPVQQYDGSWIDGMALRDYFAAKAIDYFIRDVWLEKETDDFDDAANKCYQLADAMMKAREQ